MSRIEGSGVKSGIEVWDFVRIPFRARSSVGCLGHMGGCQNLRSLFGYRCRIIIGTQKGTIILTTTHIPQLGFCSV